MNRFGLLFLAISVFALVPYQRMYAQQDSSGYCDASVVWGDAKTAWHDGVDIFTAPFHFTQPQWMETGVILGGTAALFTLDRSVRLVALRNQSLLADNVFTIGRNYGVATYGIAFSGGVYVGGLLFRSGDLRETGLALLESIAFAGIITSVVKSVVGRSRPFVEEGPFRFRGMQFKDETTSFPSGHPTVAFAISSVLSRKIKNTWASIGLYALATLTAVSRVYDDEHWTSDVFLGAAIGNAMGIAVTDLHQREDGKASFRLTPSLNGLRAELIF